MTPEERAALATDGDRYHTMNYSGIGTIADPVFQQMHVINTVSPIDSVLEIGCTTGFRLEKARREFNARCSGIELSPNAVAEGKTKFPDLDIRLGAAPADLDQWNGDTFDVIVVGHLLYLLPRSELFALAAAVDRLLAEGGHLIVMDFIYHRDTVSTYVHQGNLQVFKGDPSRPWSWSPQYFLVHRDVYPLAGAPSTQQFSWQWQTVDVLRKLSIVDSHVRVEPPSSVHES